MHKFNDSRSVAALVMLSGLEPGSPSAHNLAEPLSEQEDAALCNLRQVISVWDAQSAALSGIVCEKKKKMHIAYIDFIVLFS
jgi:hypothetical protein